MAGGMVGKYTNGPQRSTAIIAAGLAASSTAAGAGGSASGQSSNPHPRVWQPTTLAMFHVAVGAASVLRAAGAAEPARTGSLIARRTAAAMLNWWLLDSVASGSGPVATRIADRPVHLPLLAAGHGGEQ